MSESARIFVVTGDEVVRLTLTGARAHDARTVLTVTAPRCVAVDPNDPDRVYVGTFDDGLYATADGGRTWIDHNPQAHSDAHQLITHPRAPERVYEVAGQGIAVSPDRGETWTRLEPALSDVIALATAPA